MREAVLWTGKPAIRRLFHRYDYFAAGLVLAVVAGLLGMASAVDSRPALQATAGGGALLLVQAGVRWLQLRRLTYVVTDRRVLVDAGLVWRRTTSARLGGLAAPVVVPERGGTGTVTFGTVEPHLVAAARYGAHQNKSGPLPVVLAGIPEPERVRALLAEAIGAARRRRATGEPDDSLF
ncbi:hypothetical protein AB0M83_24040 [Amycolatopsis sp. NPDC051106]|jgi:hypothetical protein|uniref:hypothetical protein n=1 Tax=unclassified Amycolatopsis TaxID=2618356 RepID=UPI00342B4973